MNRRVKAYAVWYFDCIIRGPFANRKLANAALKECGGAQSELRVKLYDPDKDAQIEGWTHPSILLMMWRQKHGARGLEAHVS